jgi:lysozyme family protein
MGITLATLQRWDRNPTLDAANVMDLARSTAAAIYRALYWNVLQGDSLPAGVDLSVFDFGVNAGPGRSAMLLQEAVGFSAGEVDGCIGPITLGAVLKADPVDLIDRLAGSQAAFYRNLPEFDIFGQGWLGRTERRKDAALAMARQGVISA